MIVRCAGCGTTVSEWAARCHRCGTTVEESIQAQGAPSPTPTGAPARGGVVIGDAHPDPETEIWSARANPFGSWQRSASPLASPTSLFTPPAVQSIDAPADALGEVDGDVEPVVADAEPARTHKWL